MTIEEAIQNREKCLEYLEKQGANATPENVEAVKLSIEALKAQQSNKWTSVDERLPELDCQVLIYAVNKNYADRTSKIEISERYSLNLGISAIKVSALWREPWQYFDYDYEITHWMPLPEPPKEVEHETD